MVNTKKRNKILNKIMMRMTMMMMISKMNLAIVIAIVNHYKFNSLTMKTRLTRPQREVRTVIKNNY